MLHFHVGRLSSFKSTPTYVKENEFHVERLLSFKSKPAYVKENEFHVFESLIYIGGGGEGGGGGASFGKLLPLMSQQTPSSTQVQVSSNEISYIYITYHLELDGGYNKSYHHYQ